MKTKFLLEKLKSEHNLREHRSFAIFTCYVCDDPVRVDVEWCLAFFPDGRMFCAAKWQGGPTGTLLLRFDDTQYDEFLAEFGFHTKVN